MRSVDVCVIGGGPAGLAVASVLAASTLNVVLLGYEPTRSRSGTVGETLSSTVAAPLQQLQLEDEFNRLALPEIQGFQSTWGSAAKVWRGATVSRGGWILDRPRFEQMLGDHARRSGATLLPDKAIRISERLLASQVWTQASPQPQIEARFLVFASGRTGIRVHPRHGFAVDKLVACIAYLPASDCAWDRIVRLDALEDGWIYSLHCTPDMRTLILFTDADLLRGMTAAQRLQKISAAALAGPSLSTVVSRDCLRPITGGAILSAASHFNVLASGPRWIACGDAAQTYDPLSSLGVTVAMQDAIEAANALLESVKGDPQAMHRRDFDRLNRFLDFLLTQHTYYRSEQRWPTTTFWKRRDSGNLRETLSRLLRRSSSEAELTSVRTKF